MTILTVIALLIMTACAHAGHGVALLIGGSGDLERALVYRGFVVTREDDPDRKKIEEALYLFEQGIPTKGIALIYTNLGDSRKILQRMHRESGADLVIALAEGSAEMAKLDGNGWVFASAPENFSSNLARQLANPKAGFIGALDAASKESRGSFFSAAQASEPNLQKSAFPCDQLKAGKVAGDEWVNGYGMVFCWCPVSSEGFWLGKYEITLREFNAITRKNPRNGIATLPNHPRDGIHYDDISQFVSQLNQRERFFKRLPEGWEYALPTESQWAHVAGESETSKEFSQYANFADASLFETGDDFYHYADRRFNDGQPSLALVGSYAPNSWGIHDLFGNLWEWTATFPNADLDPKNPGNPIACGGSWISVPSDCSASSRRQFPKRTEMNFIGFRLVLQEVGSR